jgi:predicted N-acetyltransferase YhbS
MNKYTIIEADLKSDKEEIVNLLLKNMRGQTQKIYEWNYEMNPYGNALCWLAKHESIDSLVGSAAFFPRKVFLKGKEINAFITADFVVNEEHRVYGPALKLQRESHSKLKDSGFRFLYGVPNKLGSPFFYRIGYKKLGKIETFIKIIKTQRLPRDYLIHSLPSTKTSKLTNLVFTSRISLKVIDFIVKLRSKERRHKKANKYSVETPELFDERFDVFWKKAKDQFNIIGERSSDFLNWRYVKSPLQDYKIFCIKDNKRNIEGYVVYYFNDNRYYVADMLFLNKNDVLDSLLAEFALFARANEIGAIIIHYLGNSLFENRIKDFNFRSVNKEVGEVLIYSPNSSLDSDIFNKDNWHFFTGDIS